MGEPDVVPAVPRLRILLVSCVFPPEPVVSARTSGELAAHLAGRGHEVTVICPRPHRGTSEKAPTREELGGSRVQRLKSWRSRRATLASRLLENVTFGLQAALRVLVRRADRIYLNGWPLVTNGLVTAAARLRQVPIVISVQDLYPESLSAQQRMSPSSRLYRALLLLDRAVLLAGARVVTIGSRMREHLLATRGLCEDRVHVIPNWLPLSTTDAAVELPARSATQDRLVLLYAGNISRASGIVDFLEAHGEWIEQSRWRLVIAGHGSELQACGDLIRSQSWSFTSLHSPWAHSDTPQLFGAADACLLPTAGEQALASVPSKLLSYWKYKKPVVALVRPGSETEHVIRQASGGWVVAPDQPSALQSLLDQLGSDPNRLQLAGIAGLHHAATEFDGPRRVAELAHLIETAR